MTLPGNHQAGDTGSLAHENLQDLDINNLMSQVAALQAAVKALTPPATVPSAPTNVTAIAGNGTATVSFTAPASNGATITSYTVTSTPGALTGTATVAAPVTISGLTNGTAYTFAVTASSSVGQGPASAASTSITPNASFSSLVDNFNGTLALWPSGSASTTLVNGRARIVCDTGYQSLQSAAVYSLAGSAVSAQVFAPAAGGAVTDADVSMNVNSTTAGTALTIGINRVTGNITFSSQTGYYDPNSFAMPYDPIAHLWLRIRESAGTIYWETSPDGFTWTNRRATNAATPAWVVGASNLQLGFATHRDAGTVDYAEVDGVNGATLPAQLYRRCTFGAYYSDTSTGGYGDSLYTPTDGSAQYLWQQGFNITVPRVVYFAGFNSDIPSGAMYYSGKGYRLVRAWDVEYYPGPTYARALVSFADILSGARDADLNKVFTQHATFKGGVDFRMWWEMNLGGTQASPIYNGSLPKACTSAAQFIQAWQYVVNYARKNFPAADFRFCWVPNGSDGGITMESLYPGDNYVDVVGADVYNETTYSTWQTFPQKIQPIYDRLAKITTNANIPMMIGEVGSVAGSGANQGVADWLTSLFTTTAMPRMKYIDFFNINKGVDWRITTTAASTAVAKQYLAPGAATA